MREYTFTDFQTDYETNLEFGAKWFTASWLPSGKMARFIGYPDDSGVKGSHRDLSVNLIVMDSTAWTAAGETPVVISIPAPQKGFSIVPIDTITRRKLQSGRTESRRFGSGAPDRWNGVIFRIKE